MTKDVDTLFPFSARDREDAERKAEEVLQEHPYERLELKEYPRGFRIVMTHLPGTIEADTVEWFRSACQALQCLSSGCLDPNEESSSESEHHLYRFLPKVWPR